MNVIEMTNEIKRCTETLLHNQTEECRLNDKLLEPVNQDEFEQILRSRSEAIRVFYKENEECIAILNGYAKGDLTHEIALELYESIRSMFLQGRMDPGLMVMLAEPVVQYLRGREDEVERAIILSMISASCSSDYYNRMLRDYNMDKLNESLHWIISNEDSYCTFERLAARMNILYAYNALMALNFLGDDEEVLRQMLDLLRRENALWENPKVQEMDGENPEFAESVSNMKIWYPLQMMAAAIHYPDLMREPLDMFMKDCAQFEKSDNWMERCLYDMVMLFAKINRGEIADNEYAEGMIHLLEQIPDPMWKSDLGQSQAVLQMYVMVFTYLMDTVCKLHISAQEREDFAITAWNNSRRIFTDIPYQYQTSYVNGVLKTVYEKVVPCVSKPAFVEQLADELLIRRQPSTYFHSYMVEKIALMIAGKMLDKAPELFLTLPEYNTVEAIKAGQENILATISRGARLHDLGKCEIASVIMLQSRKLLDDEFACIKVHPKRGASYLEKFKEYEACVHMIRGHHKSYDGKQGYPMSFDNTASPYRLLIDLISISDSMDAATDTLGRNYATGKDLYHLLDELKQGAGTRYNPDIVRVIEESPELIEELALLTGRDRVKHCYEIYSQVV